MAEFLGSDISEREFKTISISKIKRFRKIGYKVFNMELLSEFPSKVQI